MASAIDNGKYFKIPFGLENKEYKNYENQGSKSLSSDLEYTSNNTKLLNKSEMKDLLIGLPIIQSLINGKFDIGE